jgi:hypothetical protein
MHICPKILRNPCRSKVEFGLKTASFAVFALKDLPVVEDYLAGAEGGFHAAT